MKTWKKTDVWVEYTQLSEASSVYCFLQLPNPRLRMKCMKAWMDDVLSLLKLCIVALSPPLLVLLFAGTLQTHPWLTGPNGQARWGLLRRSNHLLASLLDCLPRRCPCCRVSKHPVHPFAGKSNRLWSGELSLLLSPNHPCRHGCSQTCTSSHWVAVWSWHWRWRRLVPKFVKSWTKRPVGRSCHKVHRSYRTIVHLDINATFEPKGHLTPEKVGEATLA